MDWSTVRLIWLRELRDQLRDRRTLFMIVGLPLLLYPVLGFAVLQFAAGFVEKPSTVGLVTPTPEAGEFPERDRAALGASMAVPPVGAAASADDPAFSYPPL